MSHLLVIRHAEPAVKGVLLGRTDPPLSPGGRCAAREALGDLAVGAVYSSPLRRCTETATMIPARLVILNDLVEIAMGDWDGLAWAEAERRYPTVAEAKTGDWFGVTPPGGEPWSDFVKRVRSALGQIRRGPLSAAVVTHLAVCAVIAAELSGADPLSFTQEYCEIRRYELTVEP